MSTTVTRETQLNNDFWLPFTNNRAFKAAPKIIDRADGVYYYSDDKKILDAVSGLWYESIICVYNLHIVLSGLSCCLSGALMPAIDSQKLFKL